MLVHTSLAAAGLSALLARSAVAFGVLCVMAFFAGAIGELLRKRRGASGVLRWTMGIVPVALGIRLALP